MHIINFILHCDKYIETFISSYGYFVYLIIFMVIFCETGLVFFPFLPGDSLLFAVGTFAGMGSLNIWLLLIMLISASIIGDNVNYFVGKHLGRKILEYEKLTLVKDEHLQKADALVKKYGGKAVIIAKFMPIIRTIVPFAVGVGELDYKRFVRADMIGGTIWVTLFLMLGFFFGNFDIVKNNFSAIILGILLISVAPIFISYLKTVLRKAN